MAVGLAFASDADSAPQSEPANAEEPAPEEPAPADVTDSPIESANAQRTELNLLGVTETASGESRRNDNVQFNQIDNNALKELNARMGTTATVVEDFKVSQGYFGAEFGAAPSKPLHLAGSSYQRVRGNVYWVHDNSALRARSFFQAGKVLPARENDYGFTVETPLWRRATLNLNASQKKLRGNVNGNVLVPRLDERTPLATDPETRDFVQRMLDAYPDQGPNRIDINERALNTNSPQLIDNDNFGARLDQVKNDADRFILRYNYTLQSVDAFQLVDGQNPDTDTRSHRARATWNRAWSPATITDFSVGFDRVGSLLVPEENAVGPTVSPGRVVQWLGPSTSIPIDRATNRYRFGSNTQLLRGNHTLTFGFEAVRRQINGSEVSRHRGIYFFAADFGRDAMTNYRLGTASKYEFAIGDVHRGFRNWNAQFYVGDNWRPTSNFTLNAGLRYQPVQAPYEVNGLTEIPYSCDCNNWAPRLGLSYRLPGRWGVMRAGYGIHYGEIFTATFHQARFNPPSNLRLVVPQPDLVNPLKDFSPEDLDPNARSSVFDLASDLVAPYSHQYNFSWEPEIVSEWRLQLGYVGSRTHRLFIPWTNNRARPVEGIEHTTATINERRPDPRFFTVTRILNGSRGYFDAARARLLAPRWGGLSLEASYWFSKAVDLGGDYTNTAGSRDSFRARSQTEFDVAGDLKGLSSFDQTHAALMSVNYLLPSRPLGDNRVSGFFGDWNLSTVVLFKSGTPFGVRTGSDGPGSGNVDGLSGDRPNLTDPSVWGRTINHPDTSQEMLPASALSFIQPGQTAGNLGRNVFRKDGIANVNLALSRNFPLRSDLALTLRAEAVNLTNTPQFAEPAEDLNNPAFGQITNTLNDGRTFRFLLRLAF